MDDIWPDCRPAVEAVRRSWAIAPRAAIILGTGLGGLSRAVRDPVELEYSALPGIATTTAQSHRGRVVCGHLADTPVIMFDGRCHLYENHSVATVTLPVRVARTLGAGTLIVSNASGGLNPQYRSGDVMVLADHVNMMGKRGQVPSWGVAYESGLRGARPLTAPSPYDNNLARAACRLAHQGDFPAHLGTYVGVLGPNYETAAEYRFFRRIGGDAVGMSTVPEATLACRLSMTVVGLSVVTNLARPDAPATVSSGEVVDVAGQAARRLEFLVDQLLRGPLSNSLSGPRQIDDKSVQ